MGRGRDGGRKAGRREEGREGELSTRDRTLSNSKEWNIRRMGKLGNQ